MKVFTLRRALGVAFVVCISTSMFAQGMYWESTTTVMGTEHKSQMYYLPKMFKTVGANPQGESTSIVRLDQSKMYMVNPTEKTYSEMSFEELEGAMKKMGGQMDARMAEAQKRLESMPPEQRAMAEQMMSRMMNKGGSVPTEVEKTVETKTIIGLNCTKYLVKQGDKTLATIWATQDLKEFSRMKEDFREFGRRMMAANPMMKGMQEGMQKVDGFPVQSEMEQGMKSLVTKVESRSIAAGEFNVPAGYKKVKSKLSEGMEKAEDK